MPPLIFPQLSTADALNKIVAQVLTLRLYSNVHTPAVTDTVSDYTEAAGGGYAPVVLVSGSWTVTPGTPSIALYADYITWTFTAVPPTPVPIFGYYVTNAVNLVVYAEQIDSNGVLFSLGDTQTVRIRPRIGADNLVSPAITV